MAEIIVLSLSDSNESISSPENADESLSKILEKDTNKKSLNVSVSSDIEFPEVNFDHTTNTNESSVLCGKTFNENNQRTDSEKSSCETLSGNDDLPPIKNSKKYNLNKPSHNLSDSGESDDEANNITEIHKRSRNVKQTPKKRNNELTEERLRRKEQLAKDKALKSIAKKKAKDIKPGECIKFMEVFLDRGIQNFDYSSDIFAALREANIQYSINRELIPNSVSWKRKFEESYVDDSHKVCTTVKTETVHRVLVLWNWDDTVRRVAEYSFNASISSIKDLLPKHDITLVVYGIQDYYAYIKSSKSSTKQGKKSKTQRNTNKDAEFENYPKISRRQLETCLNEIQILFNCTSRLVDNPQDLQLMICQYTKAIAEIPYKVEKNKSFENKFDWYVMGDNRNTVRVDKDGNGLKRLWQQQLCQFNLSSLEIAEAICSVYSSPTNLLEAYMNCTQDQGMNLLKDIPIRRAAGPLTTSRKIGLELSKKIYTMFTSKDGGVALQ